MNKKQALSSQEKQHKEKIDSLLGWIGAAIFSDAYKDTQFASDISDVYYRLVSFDTYKNICESFEIKISPHCNTKHYYYIVFAHHNVKKPILTQTIDCFASVYTVEYPFEQKSRYIDSNSIALCCESDRQFGSMRLIDFVVQNVLSPIVNLEPPHWT